MKKPFFLAIALAFSCAISTQAALAGAFQKQPDARATIVADLRDFSRQLSAQNYPIHPDYVSNRRSGWYGANEWFDYWKQQREGQVLELANCQVTLLTPLLARAAIKLNWRKKGRVTEASTETLILSRLYFSADPYNNYSRPSYSNWKIHVGQRDEVLKKSRLSLERAALFLRQHAEWDKDLVTQARQEAAFWRLRKLRWGMINLVLDFDDRYAFSPPHLREALHLYIPNIEQVLRVPGTSESFTFNSRLCGQSENSITDWEHTVLFYDGKDEQLNFRYNGKGLVGFIDGRVVLVSPFEEKFLTWKQPS